MACVMEKRKRQAVHRDEYAYDDDGDEDENPKRQVKAPRAAAAPSRPDPPAIIKLTITQPSPPDHMLTPEERSLQAKYATLRDVIARRPAEPAKPLAIPTAEDARSALAALAALQDEESEQQQAALPLKRGPSKRSQQPRPSEETSNDQKR